MWFLWKFPWEFEKHSQDTVLRREAAHCRQRQRFESGNKRKTKIEHQNRSTAVLLPVNIAEDMQSFSSHSIIFLFFRIYKKDTWYGWT